MFTKILLLYSVINTGDVAHANVIYKNLSQNINSLERFEVDANFEKGKEAELISSFKEKIKQMGDEKYVIFAVGEKGSQALSLITKAQSIKFDNAYVGLGIHQYFDSIKNLPLDYIAIPKSSVSSDEKKAVIDKIKKHTLTFAVPAANPSKEELAESYKKWEVENKPNLDNKYIVVMLPGDAPDNKTIRNFTIESAEELFNDIRKLWKNNSEYKVIVQNGPRTGKFDDESDEVKGTHEFKKGEDEAVAIDEVSKYFVKLLENDNIPHSFYNFAFEVSDEGKKALSHFNPILYLAQSNADNYFIVPAESVSMLGQIPLYISSHHAIAFKPSSMNEDHEGILKAAFDLNFISYFNKDGSITYPKEDLLREVDDATLVVKDLMEGFEMKFLGEHHNVSDAQFESF